VIITDHLDLQDMSPDVRGVEIDRHDLSWAQDEVCYKEWFPRISGPGMASIMEAALNLDPGDLRCAENGEWLCRPICLLPGEIMLLGQYCGPARLPNDTVLPPGATVIWFRVTFW
jgi:hypothetical protein